VTQRNINLSTATITPLRRISTTNINRVGPLFGRLAAMPKPDPFRDALSAFTKAWGTATIALALLLVALAVSHLSEDPVVLHHTLNLALLAMGD
jgi:hypothetical protein